MTTLDERLERITDFLAKATAGRWTDRLPLEDSENENLCELEYGVNMLLDELERSRSESEARQAEIDAQTAQILQHEREQVRRLSTPVITVWPQVLAMPIIGEVSPQRAEALTEAVLTKVIAARATHIILDLTGLTEAGDETARSLIRLLHAVRLLGGRCLLTGIGPQVAQALIRLSDEQSELVALPTLADAISLVLRERGVQLVTTSR